MVVSAALVAGTLWAAPAASGAVDDVRGTWVLQEASSVETLDRAEPEITAALQHPGVIGLTVRVPWSSLEPREGVYRLGILDRAREIAGTKQLSIRFMAGRFTPSFRMGNSMIYDGSATNGSGRGEEVPLPFGREGGKNKRFERGWKRLVDQLIAWSAQNDVRLVHMSWPGLLWAELALVDQMTEQPGYSYAAARNTHLRLLDYALANTSDTLSVGFATTGHAPSQLNADITNRLLASEFPTRCFFQINNLAPDSTWLPSGGPPPLRAAQVITGSNSYDWVKVYNKLETMSGVYLEVYTSSFSGGTSASLLEEAALFA